MGCLLITQLEKCSPFENQNFLFVFKEKKRMKEKSTILNYAFESNCSVVLRTEVKVFNSSYFFVHLIQSLNIVSFSF